MVALAKLIWCFNGWMQDRCQDGLRGEAGKIYRPGTAGQQSYSSSYWAVGPNLQVCNDPPARSLVERDDDLAYNGDQIKRTSNVGVLDLFLDHIPRNDLQIRYYRCCSGIPITYCPSCFSSDANKWGSKPSSMLSPRTKYPSPHQYVAVAKLASVG